MPKLDTTIDKLERTTNKVTGTVPSSSWTDTQYPSAKTLYNTYSNLINLMHPVGSILTTSTNTNPSATIGGTWDLVDKAFKSDYITLDPVYWTNTNAELNDTSTVSLVDHSINIRLKITPSVQLTDSTVELGTLVIGSLGVLNLPYSILNAVAQSDGGQCTICYNFAYDTGKLTVFDVINIDGTHTMEAGQSFYVNIQEDIPYNLMTDDFCDKFYWKRTA